MKASKTIKAKWLGIKAIKVSENNTSKTCHRCGHKWLRAGLFKCPHCGYQYNTDYNGYMDILKRAKLFAYSRCWLETARTRYDEPLRATNRESLGLSRGECQRSGG